MADGLIQTAPIIQINTTGTITFNNTPDPLSVLICHVFATVNTLATTSLTQTNVTWTLVSRSNTARCAEVWIGIVAGTPGTTIAVVNNGVLNYICEEWGGLDGTNTNSKTGTTSTNPLSPSITPTKNKRVLVIATFQSQQGLTAGPTNSFTLAPQGTTQRVVAYIIVNLTAGESYQTGYTAVSGGWDSVICVFPFTNLLAVSGLSSYPPQFSLPGGILAKKQTGHRAFNGPGAGTNYNISVGGSLTPSGTLAKSYGPFVASVLGIMNRVMHPLYFLPSSIFNRKSIPVSYRTPAGTNYSISVGGSITPSGTITKSYSAGGAGFGGRISYWFRRRFH